MKNTVAYPATLSTTKIIISIALLVALGPLATDMYLPALPTLVKDLNTDAASVQITLSIYFFGFAIGQLIYGPLSDRFGRKPVLQFGLIVFVLSSVVASLTTSIETLIAVRLLQALGGCAGPVLGRAMVRDLFSGEEAGQVLSHIASSMALAPAIAPVIGGLLTVAYGWQANFWFLFAYGLLALGVLTFSLSETNQQKNPDATKVRALFSNYIQIAKHQQWQLYTLICSLIFAGLFAFLSASSFVLIEFLGVSELQYGLLFAVIVMGYIIGSQLSARMSKKLGAFKLIRFGCWLAMISGLAMLGLSLIGSTNVVSIIAPHFFFMIAVGISMPLAMAGALNPFPDMAGAASGLLGTTQMLIAAGFGVIIGHWNTGTPTVMAAGIAFAGVSSFMVMKRLKYVLRTQN